MSENALGLIEFYEQNKGVDMAKSTGKSKLEEAFLWACLELGLPRPGREMTFHKKRMWRIDFVWGEPHRIAVEIEGGTFGRPVVCHACGSRVKRKLKNGRWTDVREGGRHNTGAGAAKDAEKYNELTLHGYRLLRFTTTQMKHPVACAEMVKELLENSP